MKSELDLFTVPSTQVAVENSTWEEINLMNALTHGGPYEFRLPADNKFLDLSSNLLIVKLRVVRRVAGAVAPLTWVAAHDDPVTGANVPEVAPREQVAFINLIGKTFFNQVKLFLNNHLVYDSGDTYAYRAFIETEFNYGKDVKTTYLEEAGYEKDSTSPNDIANNVGYDNRLNEVKLSRHCEFGASLHIDLFQQKKYLINQMELKLELHRNKDPFVLHTLHANPHNDFHVEVLDMKWRIKKVELPASLTRAMESALATKPLKYPLVRSQIKVMYIDPGRVETPSTVIFSGQLPRRVCFGLVAYGDYYGDYTRAPFNFQHFNAISVQVIAGGKQYPPLPLTMDYANDRFVRPYMMTMDALGYVSSKRSCNIDAQNFRWGTCIYCFDISPDQDHDDSTWQVFKEGTLSIHMRFGQPIPAGGVNLIVLGEFENCLTIDKMRNVFADYIA